MSLRVRRLAIAVCLLAAPATAPAQLPPVGVARGLVRLELDGSMDTWDSRYLHGTRAPLGAELSSPALGSDRLPFLLDADIRLQRILGTPGYRLSLGRLTTDALADESRGILGVSLGLTRAITVFGRLPLVRARTQSAIALDPTGADAGLNPGTDAQTDFFTELDAALTELSANISNGAYNGDAAKLALAQSTLSSAAELGDDLFGLLADPSTASPFVPTSSSTTGIAVNARITALQATLADDLGVAGFTATPVLPAEPVSGQEFVAFLSDPIGPVGLRTGDSKVTFRGDAEAGVAVTLLDHWDRNGHLGGFRAAAEGLVRFPTGTAPRPDRLFPVGTGDGQTDIEGRLTIDLGTKSIGVRLEGDYNRQLAGDIGARVAPPSQPLAGRGFITVVRKDPGDVASFAVRPFVRIARSLAIQGSALYWSRGNDAVSYADTASAIPGVDPSVLAEDTKASATVLGVGLTYANPGKMRPGGEGLPVDAGWSYQRVVRATGGRVANRHSVTARFRVYFGIF